MLKKNKMQLLHFVIWCLLLAPSVSFCPFPSDLPFPCPLFHSFCFLQNWLLPTNGHEHNGFIFLCLISWWSGFHPHEFYSISFFFSFSVCVRGCECVHLFKPGVNTGVIPWEPAIHFLWHGFPWPGTHLLVTEPAPGICLSLPLQRWHCKCASLQAKARGEKCSVVLPSPKDYEAPMTRTERYPEHSNNGTLILGVAISCLIGLKVCSTEGKSYLEL